MKHLITRQIVSEKNLAHAREMRHSMTPAEEKLWDQLRGSRLDGLHFRRQQIIGPYIVDFLCNPAQLVIEVDGEVHFKSEAYDRERDRFLMSMGLKVLHFWNCDVNEDMDAVLERILEEVRSGERNVRT